jgi:hypothetical protein
MREQLAYDEINLIAASDIPSAEKFALFYENKLWMAIAPGINRNQSVTGWGSTLDSTCLIRPALEQFLREMNIVTLFDAPCGDHHWIRHVHFNCAYIGGDIVPSVIAALKEECGGSKQFFTFDITKDEFPEADVWLCRACMQHLCNDEIMLALDNFRRSRVRIALLSNSMLTSNYDIKTGGSRAIDLTKPPFNLPRPRWTLADNPHGESRHIGVWYREDLL